ALLALFWGSGSIGRRGCRHRCSLSCYEAAGYPTVLRDIGPIPDTHEGKKGDEYGLAAELPIRCRGSPN
ncbi:MAG: hypothetical protein ACKVIW_01780, partial [bacterium]